MELGCFPTELIIRQKVLKQCFPIGLKKSVGLCALRWNRSGNRSFLQKKKSVGMVKLRWNRVLGPDIKNDNYVFCNYSMFTPIIFRRICQMCSFFHRIGTLILAPKKLPRNCRSISIF